MRFWLERRVLQRLTTDDVSVWYHPVHATKDGYVTANVGPDFRAWANVCQAMGRPIVEDERFNSQAKVRENLPAASEIVSAWLAGLTSVEAEAILTTHHIACGIVRTVEQAVRQPQVEARNLVVEVDDPVYGPAKVINSAFKYARADAGVTGPAPMLGEHNDAVLNDLLGYTPERIQKLWDDGVLQKGDA